MTAISFAMTLLLTLAIHRVMLWFWPGVARQRVTAVACAMGVVVSLMLPRTESWPLASLTSATAAHLYFHFFNMGETARRIKLLLQIEAGQDPRRSYSADEMVHKRIRRLSDLGIIGFSGGRFYLRKKGLARLALLMRKYERLLFPERT